MPPILKEGHIASGAFVRLFVMLFDAYHNFRNVLATVLKFLIWIPQEKIANKYFFSRRDYAPFLSYGPLKNMDAVLSAKYFKNY